MSDVILKCHNISKTYDMGEVQVKALKHASFEVYAGEFIVILGPSGSGKSTLLNIVGGMDVPTGGEVVFREDKLHTFNERALTEYRRHKVGFIFQFYNLLSNLTARENVELATELCYDPLDVEDVLRDVGLEERMDHFPAQMSGGEQQRVAIARAVAKNPDILLCDEPTGALDYSTGVQILKVLSEINTRMHKTVIVITHNAAIGEMAQRVIRMRSGEITEIQTNEHPMDPERIEW